MGAVGLHYGRGVLTVNAVMVQGKDEPHSLGIYNLFVGVLQVAVPFYIIATAGDPGMIMNNSEIFLFGFTYRYVGFANVWGFDTSGLGWYCL